MKNNFFDKKLGTIPDDVMLKSLQEANERIKTKNSKLNNDVEEDYCSYEVSKLLAEKGFDCYFILGSVTSLYDKEGKVALYSNYGFKYSGLSEGYISRPTQNIVVKWLMINFKLTIYYQYINEYEDQLIYSIYKKDEGIIEVNTKDLFNSKKEVIDAAVEHILTKLL